MPNPNDSDPIPSFRSPEKRQSQFTELGNDPIAKNGKRTMPRDLEHKIETWLKHGGKILNEMKVNSLMVNQNDLFCVVTRDREKIAAVNVALGGIDTKRKAEAAEKNK